MKGTFLTICSMLLLLVVGCGVFGKKGVPKEQLNTDIAGKTVKAQEGDLQEWDFKTDTGRCFTLNENETRVDEKGAEVTIVISAYKANPINTDGLDTVFGKVLLKYKKENDKWVLENIEPKDLIAKTISKESISAFMDVYTPLCRYYDYSNYK